MFNKTNARWGLPISQSERTMAHKVFTTPMSNRVRAILLIGESIGFDARHINAGKEFDALIQEYDEVVKALRAANPIGLLYEKGLDRQITRILFPTAGKMATMNNLNLIAGIQTNAISDMISQRERQNVSDRWQASLEAEVRYLRNSHLFLKDGASLIRNDTLYTSLSDTDAFDVFSRVSTLHDGFTGIIETMSKTDNFPEREQIFLNQLAEQGTSRIFVKDVQAFFIKTTTLSLLRYFVTRLWILEHFCKQTEE